MTEFPETSETLIAKVCDPDDRVAWERFEQLYRPIIFRIARRRGLQHNDAMDLVQQVLLSVANAVSSYQKRGSGPSFRRWLSIVIRNAILKSVQRTPQDRAKGGSKILDVLGDVPSPDPGIESLIETEYQRELYLRASAIARRSVSEPVWLAFEWTVLQERPIEQVARLLNLSVGSVYAARSRVVRRLRDQILLLEDRGDS